MAFRVEPLVWGHGPREFEVFLEPTCPYSGKAFGKLEQLLAEAGEDRVTVKIRLHSQPWHMFSPVIVRAIYAAASLPEGKAAAWKVMAAVYAHKDEFEFERHATGPNRDATPNDIIRRIEAYAGLALMAAFDEPLLDRSTRWDARYARQNGIHVSPSFMIDGIFQADMSSGDEVAAWVKRLE
ncbi:DsbA family protein [Devosia sp.]|uniref:DsbA family protein n=1 Tax=Devosia sp. TaxID=1871048 RepID=UPI003BACD724